MVSLDLGAENDGLVFNIQRYSIQDGPGIRTTVFLKGCPLRCLWCSNPEGQSLKKEFLFFRERCDRECRKCAGACPVGAIKVNADGSKNVDRFQCTTCGECVKACPNEALSISGKVMTAKEVVEEVRKDSLFFSNSDGGVTLSGGEPAFQADFTVEILNRCRKLGIHTCLETSGYAKPEVFDAVLEEVDLLLFDIKHTDSSKHKELTGVDNSPILRNIERAVNLGKPLVLRVPVIPGCNDSETNIGELGNLARSLGILDIDLIPYHRLGVRKYQALGKEYGLSRLESLQKEKVNRMSGSLRSVVPGAKINVV